MWPTLSLLRTQQHELACNRTAFFSLRTCILGPPTWHNGQTAGQNRGRNAPFVKPGHGIFAGELGTWPPKTCPFQKPPSLKCMKTRPPKTLSKDHISLKHKVIGWWPRHEDVWQLLLAVPEYPAAHCHLKAWQVAPGKLRHLQHRKKCGNGLCQRSWTCVNWKLTLDSTQSRAYKYPSMFGMLPGFEPSRMALRLWVWYMGFNRFCTWICDVCWKWTTYSVLLKVSSSGPSVL